MQEPSQFRLYTIMDVIKVRMHGCVQNDCETHSDSWDVKFAGREIQ